MRNLSIFFIIVGVVFLTIYLPTSKKGPHGIVPVVTEEIKYWESLSEEEKKELYLSKEEKGLRKYFLDEV
ncbi:MAG: hypothetical protein DRQ88_11685 [Epsilonproteobacteria bacterium]|nr:MAG: hypothetical protein DRQ88_11685 [Campylobacterota bacterium]